MNILLITNPSSGGSDEQLVEEIVVALERLGTVTHIEPEKDSFKLDVRAGAASADLVVAAGGDGTLHYVVNALHDRLEDISLGLLPMGTGNDFARTLGSPSDPVEAAGWLVDGEERIVDVCRASGAGMDRFFINACMGGFPVEVDEKVDDSLKRRLGPVAFWVAGAKAAVDLTRYTVTIDGERVEDCVAAGVGNGRTCGGGIEVWPDADPGDGVLEGRALPAPGALGAARLALKVKGGKHDDIPGVVPTRGPTITIDSEPPMEFNVDGEVIDLKTPVTFEVVSSVRFRVGRP